jgi:hypothetical protein
MGLPSVRVKENPALLTRAGFPIPRHSLENQLPEQSLT